VEVSPSAILAVLKVKGHRSPDFQELAKMSHNRHIPGRKISIFSIYFEKHTVLPHISVVFQRKSVLSPRQQTERRSQSAGVRWPLPRTDLCHAFLKGGPIYSPYELNLNESLFSTLSAYVPLIARGIKLRKKRGVIRAHPGFLEPLTHEKKGKRMKKR